jgi:hypothetical protein
VKKRTLKRKKSKKKRKEKKTFKQKRKNNVTLEVVGILPVAEDVNKQFSGGLEPAVHLFDCVA